MTDSPYLTAGEAHWLSPDEAEELAREASDPRTSTERLVQLMGPPEGTDASQLAVLANPSCPGDILISALTAAYGEPLNQQIIAWQNATVAGLIHRDPEILKPECALNTLQALEAHELVEASVRPPPDLATAVALWACTPYRTPGHVIVRDFARRLASLFSLPWSEEDLQQAQGP